MADHGLVELARVWRGPVVESVHHGAVTVCDLQGRYRHAWGNPGWVVTPRSALKPFQAIALVESGAADAFGLTSEHIALACASHQAQDFQVALVRDWLARLGLDESALVCGPALPAARADQGVAWANGGPSRIYNDCSGKHCGFLTVSRHLGAGLDYANPAHPAQKLYMDILSEFVGEDASKLPRAADSCGLPAIAMPLGMMARATAKLGVGWAKTPARRAAVRRVLDAMLAHPDHLAGRDEPVARLLRFCEGNVIAKGGAEGYVMAAVRDKGLGIVVKMGDGAGRAKMGVLARILGRVGALPVDQAEALVLALDAPVTDSNGQDVGRVEVVVQPPETTKATKADLAFWVSGVIDEDTLDLFRPR